MPALLLSTTQRRFLKQHAHHLKPIIHMGKEGPTPGFLAQLEEQLKAHELLKLRVLDTCETEKEDIEATFAEAEITVVQKVGHVFTVYKERDENPSIHLPKR